MFGTKASLIIDLFLVIQVLILPALVVAVMLVRRGKIKAHATIMTSCFVLFVFSVVALEVDVRFGETPVKLPFVTFVIHLCFALPAVIVWIRQIATAKTAITDPAKHRRRGKILFGLLFLTVGTGIWLYVAAFA